MTKHFDDARRSVLAGLLAAVFVSGIPCAIAADAAAMASSSTQKKHQRQQAILAAKDRTLADLYKMKPETRDEIAKAPGYAVFDATGMYLVLYQGQRGAGVLIDNADQSATYMKMTRAGTGPGVGVTKFRLVLVFKTKALMDQFKTLGADVGASGQLILKRDGGGTDMGTTASFNPNMSVYQINDKGIAVQASWGGTAFTPDKELI